ncbi:MAG: DNA replication/repair protein RecF [Armatimonadota bacterium]
MDELVLCSPGRGKVAPVRGMRLRCTNFRCFANIEVSFAPSRNLFVGKNAQGKTTLIEAIHLIATTTSFRTNTVRDVIRGGESFASAELESTDPPSTLEIQVPARGRRVARLNRLALPKVSDLVGRFPSVVFTSQDLRLVTAEPADRRRFLDQEISQLSPAYFVTLFKFRRALDQRNALLKEIHAGHEPPGSLDVWDHRLAESGAEIRTRRLAFVEELAGFAREEHHRLSGGTERLDVRILAKDGALEAGALLQNLTRARQVDIAAGTTTAGPHRDDVELLLNGEPVRKRGSQGQQRTVVLALKLALLSLWQEREGRLPVLLLDDIMSDLDQTRRARVLEVTGKMGQVFITSTELQNVSDLLDEDSRVFTLEGGRLAT